MRGRYFRFFSLVIYLVFFSDFPTLFSQVISIFIILLHTFSMGVKIDAGLPQERTVPFIMRSGVFLLPPVSTGVLEPLQKWEWSCFEHTSSLTFFIPGAPPIFFNGSSMPALTRGCRRTPLHIMKANCSLLGSHASIFTPIENVWRRLMNLLMRWENKMGKINTKILYKSRAF